ncbi:MAG: hypothetical protein NT171_21910 [Planctomycetota bacterium]|nr:hypothetical protein [Planctomycetota bacterium]
MNLFDPHDGDDADDAVGPEPHSSGRWIEALLRGRGLPAPDAGFRELVVVAMEEAARERRLMLAGEGRFAPASNPRQRFLPEMLAGIAAAIVVSIVPWGSGSRGGVAPEAKAAAPVMSAPLAPDEPPDVHQALALLDARRDLFAALSGSGRHGAEF